MIFSKNSSAVKRYLQECNKEYTRQRGGKLVSDEIKGDLRLETFELPDGQKHVFVSPVPTGGSDAEPE